MPKFQPLEHSGCAAGGRGHDEMIVCETGGHPIIHDHAVLATHETVSTFADAQLHPGVGVDSVQEFARIGTLDINFPQR